jgi:hypothetical protein
MSIGREYVSELRPPTGLLFILEMVCEFGEPRWINTGMETDELGENLSQYHFVHHKSDVD